MRVALTGAILLAASLLVMPLADAAGADLHRLWDNRCAECHGHAGDFARQFLSNNNGQLQGRHHVHDLRRFMQNHYLPASEVDGVYKMLLAQANIKPRFKEECSICHQSAASFVRESLTLRDGQLYSRKSGSPVRPFLESHRALSPEDVEFYLQLLTRVAGEVSQP